MKSSTQRWLKGGIAAVVSGGSGAAASSITTAVIDPDKFNPMTQVGHFATVAIASFLFSAGLHLFMYLQQNPVPPDDTTFITKPAANDK